MCDAGPGRRADRADASRLRDRWRPGRSCLSSSCARALRNRPAAGSRRAGPSSACGRAGRASAASRESRPAAGRGGPRRTRRPIRETPARACPSRTSLGVRLLPTMNRAMSPTTFEVGVTLTMSPNRWLTSAYIRQTSGQRRPGPAPAPADTGSCTGRPASRCGRRRAVGASWPVSNGGVELRTACPVVGRLLERLDVQAGVARLEAQRLDQRVQIRLAGHARRAGPSRHRRSIDAFLGREQQRGDLAAGGVVRVEVDRHADFLLQRLHQRLGGVRLAQAGHVLDGRAGWRRVFSSSLASVDVILQVVLRS